MLQLPKGSIKESIIELAIRKISSKFSVMFSQIEEGLKNRFYFYYGGRGSCKSWAVAMFLVFITRKRKYRVLCTREFQKNIKDFENSNKTTIGWITFLSIIQIIGLLAILLILFKS